MTRLNPEVDKYLDIVNDLYMTQPEKVTQVIRFLANLSPSQFESVMSYLIDRFEQDIHDEVDKQQK